MSFEIVFFIGEPLLFIGEVPSPPQGKVFGHVKGHRDSAELVGKVNKVFVFKEEIMA